MNTITIGTPRAATKTRCELISGTKILVIDPTHADYATACGGIKAAGGPVGNFDVITPAAFSAIREVFGTLAPVLIPEGRKIYLTKTIQLVSELTGNRLGLSHAKTIADLPAVPELESVYVEVWA